jgi:hypothetical protein
MYNKIASIILNSGKTTGLSDVFVAQPDALKENLAGKIFVLAEIGGKKTEGRKIWNFLISSLNDNYYNDEKILLRDKIEGLKIENIFEAALTKTNKALGEFLLAEKIKINSLNTHITLGVVYENKLHFSNFGKNRALLFYRRSEQWEIINVEANIPDSPETRHEESFIAAKMPILFSSVISGEIPTGSYFVFTSEALLEYLSGQEMVDIITKLPPIVAAEQIKNVLMKINTYVPFLGVIIKNTAGLVGQETKEEGERNLTAQGSISSLNYTEQKTERMLAPAGLINFSKTFKKISKILKKIATRSSSSKRKIYKPIEDKISQPPLDLGKIRSLNLARSDSFLVKEKIFFKKRTNWFGTGLKKTIFAIPRLFNSSFWKNLGINFKSWLKTLNQKNRLLFVVLAVLIVVFLISLLITRANKRQQAAKNQLNDLVTQIENKQNLIDSHLLYNDEEGSRIILGDTQALLNSLPQKTSTQKNIYERLVAKTQEQEIKIQKIIKIDQAEKVNDLVGLGVESLIFADNKIYGAGDKFIYILTPNSASSSRIDVDGAINLSNPHFDKRGVIYYWNDNKVAQLTLKTKQTGIISISDEVLASGPSAFGFFNSGKNLYILSQEKNQIYRYSCRNNDCASKTDWFKEAVDLSKTSDFFVNAADGRIYVLNSNGAVSKFYTGKKEDYSASAVSPTMTNANKIIVGTNYVYIFEADSKRLVVLALKDGHLMNQYQANALQAPKDLAIDEAGKAAYFLDGEAIYRINLNQ